MPLMVAELLTVTEVPGTQGAVEAVPRSSMAEVEPSMMALDELLMVA